MTRPRRALLWTGGLLLALIAAAVIFILTFNYDRLRPWIDARVSAAIGRPFEIRGHLRVHWTRDRYDHSWLPGPQFTAHDIRVGNPAWAGQQNFAHLDALRFRLSLWPLLSHTIDVPTLILSQPSVHLAREKSRNNWTFKALQNKSGKPSAWHVRLNRIVFDQGTLSLHDPVDSAQVTVHIKPLDHGVAYKSPSQSAHGAKVGASDTAVRPYAFAFDADGHYHGAMVSAHGRTGGVLALRDGEQAFPLTAHAQVGDVVIDLTGHLQNPLSFGGLAMRLKVSGNSMAHLYPLTGITLPDTPPFETDGDLTASFKPGDERFNYRHFNGRVGASDLHGDLSFTMAAPRPKLSGMLHSDHLSFADLGPLIGADTGSHAHALKAKAVVGQAMATPPKGQVLPTTKFRTERWKAMDADIRLTGEHIEHGKNLPISHLKAHLVLDNGRLTLNPLNFAAAGGTLESRIDLDGRAQPMKARLRLDVKHIKLRQLAPQIKTMRKALGEINGNIALSATGNSVAALLGHSNGQIKLLMNDGVVSRELMELAGLNVGSYVVVKLFGDEPVPIDCAATNLVDRDGVMRTRLALFDTDNALVNIKGKVNFANEHMDLDITPHTKGLRVFSLRSPLYVKGTFADPDVGVHAGKLLLRGGGALALGVFATPAAALLPLIAPSQDANTNPCRRLLSRMKQPAKAPPAGKTEPTHASTSDGHH
ncbi:AsmA family protein [Oleiagrimonas sp. C23AA]|uniref:AsmA family protein n=1 Tax=Oleiagrimonas sp. C23AA TaxID=2719047 RepID=UPI00141EE68D|nr:AsmA family protein [Oleiagrimonas sp. C23AA]NII09292.1 AsmA family protein [Oleiagrimonas sp. C23AA]